MSCEASDVAAAVRAAADVIERHRVELTDLDRPIGDGDHGENMNRGFTAVLATLDTTVPDTPAGVLKVVATTLISKVGGAAGPLYGTAFLRAATSLGQESRLDSEGLVTVLRAGLEGVVARGKAEVGDATMVDALSPAVEAAEAAKGEGIAAQLAAAADAADEGARSTVPLVARKGRASYLGERSVGHLDPGARSTALLLRAFADAAR
ncbi:dihydroxyacetone kinase, phosphoprotein-dependent, L subunit [Saccharomonospora marina XMU15]|uniref:Dihydroxyacetone kinase, phosphoprotein-dependent, L subunit n=1 Tax=Saccharomonospora marina XMU15 TaxID=882083 RepID=H5X503_9PSEU|nr:dihydroxyacetone kinase subunit DhaL [Saccharomonospora marina]EHR52282.1 dihydroxyacetone kinase, phosphoprotein-dependent, L subunit [Saccharomonospora marina XMU15]